MEKISGIVFSTGPRIGKALSAEEAKNLYEKESREFFIFLWEEYRNAISAGYKAKD